MDMRRKRRRVDLQAAGAVAEAYLSPTYWRKLAPHLRVLQPVGNDAGLDIKSQDVGKVVCEWATNATSIKIPVKMFLIIIRSL